MKKKGLIILFFLVHLQVSGFDERDVLVEKLIQPETTVEGAEGLFELYQLGGVRTILKQFNNMPHDLAYQYAYSLRNLDLFRFRNDLNANLQEAKTVEQKGVALMVLSSLGRQIDSEIFLTFAEDVNENIKVRLAALSCLAAIQNPKYFELFAQVAEESVVDYETGQNDFMYCDMSNVSKGLFYFLKPRLNERSTATHGVKMVMLHALPPNATDFFDKMLENREKKYFSMMINKAMKCGGTELLDYLANDKRAKKLKDQIDKARPVAAMINKYKAQIFSASNQEQFPIGSLVSRFYSVKGRDELSASFAVIKVDATGTISMVQEQSPVGMTGAFNNLIGKKTMAAKLDFAPVESLYFAVAPF